MTPRRRQDDRTPHPVTFQYGFDQAGVPKNLTDVPSWLRTLVAIVVAAVSAGAGAAIWLSSHFVSNDRFESFAGSQERAGYIRKEDFEHHVEVERQMVIKADGLAADFASLKTDLAWVKQSLVRIEDSQTRGRR